MIPRAIALDIVLGVWLSLGLLWVLARLRVKRTEVCQSRQSLTGYVVLLMVSFLLLMGVLPVGDVRLLNTRPEATSVAMVIAGAALAVWSRLVLGGNWSGAIALKVDHELVERGPYRFVRHPIYTGLILMFLGTALLLGRAQALGACVLFFALHVWKFRKEEALLLQRFPVAFAAYKARTKALVPFVF
jgi:protein-S-isoprenylcysteine O-methyltransferase Ste14